MPSVEVVEPILHRTGFRGLEACDHAVEGITGAAAINLALAGFIEPHASILLTVPGLSLTLVEALSKVSFPPKVAISD